MESLRMYWIYLKLSVKSQWQYRANFVLVSVGVFLGNILDALGLWALFERFGAIPGWTLAEAMVLYGLVNVTFALADTLWRGFDIFNRFIQNGELDRMLLRPRPLPLQLLGAEFRINRVGRLAQGVLVLALGLAGVHVAWSAARVLLLLWAACGGILLFGGMFVLQATLSVFSVESIEMVNAISYGGVYIAGYPMEVYGDTFRTFFTYVVPLAAVVYLPVCALLGKGVTLGAAFLWPLAGAAFLAVAFLVFYRLGLPRYTSVGA